MSEDYLVDYCAPTLAGIKTASLMSVKYETINDATADIREMNSLFLKKRLRAIPFKFRRNRALIYVYRPGFLKRDLKNQKVAEALSSLGYDCSNPEACIAHLATKVRNNSDFPHEIGFFLGYPPKDVLGFMKYAGKNYKCMGMWKVYDDERAAQKKFHQYDKCRAVYLQDWKNGRCIEDLTVATAF